MLKFSVRNLLLSLVFLGLIFAAISAARSTKIFDPVAKSNVAVESPRGAANFNTMYTSGAAPERRAFSAAEEAYSISLWRIHDKVKTSAVQLSFAGLSYKLKELDRAGVKAKVAPQMNIYRDAQSAIGKLSVPDSLKELHANYANAVGLYAEASGDMIKIADDGNEQHLLDAHSKTNQAATLLLKVGAELWPGEFKPN
jgi:hypothetical protein